MKCPACSNAELVHETRDVPYTHNDRTCTIRAVTGDFCPACNEMFLDHEQRERYAGYVKCLQALDLIAGLWAKRESGPVDGLEYQEMMRAEWDRD